MVPSPLSWTSLVQQQLLLRIDINRVNERRPPPRTCLRNRSSLIRTMFHLSTISWMDTLSEKKAASVHFIYQS